MGTQNGETAYGGTATSLVAISRARDRRFGAGWVLSVEVDAPAGELRAPRDA